MINLLSVREKRKLSRQRRLRFVVVVLCASFILEIMMLVFFIPSYYTTYVRAKKYNAELQKQKMLSLKGDVEVQIVLKNIKKESDLLKPDGATTTSKLLETILSEKTAGIEISAVAFEQEGNSSKIILSGRGDREDLLLFQKKLKGPDRIAAFSQSFITKKTDIDFTLTITTK